MQVLSSLCHAQVAQTAVERQGCENPLVDGVGLIIRLLIQPPGGLHHIGSHGNLCIKRGIGSVELCGIDVLFREHMIIVPINVLLQIERTV